MEVLLSRVVVVTLAVLGAVLSTAAALLKARNAITEPQARGLNWLGYVLMGVSMALFVVAGLLGARG